MALTTWKLTNVSVKLNPKAKGTDTAMAIRADTIIRNGKPLDGHNINLTVAHLIDPTFSLKVNEVDRTATLTRTEGKRGRKASAGASVSDINAFLANVKA